jgi:transposase
LVTAPPEPPKEQPKKFDKYKHLIYENIVDQKEKMETNKVIKVKIDENLKYEKQHIPKAFDPFGLLQKGKKEMTNKPNLGQNTNKFDEVR